MIFSFIFWFFHLVSIQYLYRPSYTVELTYKYFNSVHYSIYIYLVTTLSPLTHT